jgi:YHS domain-containing protein
VEDAVTKDPVCESTIDPSRAVARTEHAGRLYYFCSSACERAFAGDPQRYAERRRCSPTAPSRTARRRALTISRSRSRSASPSRAAGRATAAERGRAKGPPAPDRTTRLDRRRERLSARRGDQRRLGAGRNGGAGLGRPGQIRAIVDRSGIRRVLPIPLSEEEIGGLRRSADAVRDAVSHAGF